MLKVSRSPMEGSMSAQRRRNRRAAASDSLASLMTTVPSDKNSTVLTSSSSSSSARKKHSKHHHHHRLSTPSSLEQIATTSAATPIIPAEESSSTAAPLSPNRNSSGSNKKSAKSKHSGKRSYLSMASSLSSLAMDTDTQQLGGNTNAASPQKKSPKKKRQMSPRSKSKLDSLVTQQQQQQQQQPQQVEDDTEEKETETSQQHRPQSVKDVEPIAKGSLVMVQPRTWPGMNKLGGVGRVIAVHSSTSYDIDSSRQHQQTNEEEGGSSSNIIDANTTTTYDVSYVLGGKDKDVEAEYVSVHDANLEAPRERHQRTSISMTKPETDDKPVPKKKTMTKKKKKIITSTVTTEASPTKEEVSSKKGSSTKINSSVRGKQLQQLKQVKDQHVAAAAEEGSTASVCNLKSPAFSLSSQFSKQDGTFSPLDYLAESYPKIDTPVLETYAEKWGNNEPKKVDQQKYLDEEDEEERDDDPSSSVVSTDEDESGFTPPKRRQKRASPVEYSRSERMKRDMSPPSENKDLEREYGRLALKKQEIERKMKIYKSDAEKINPWAATSARGSNMDTSGSSLLGNSSPDRSEAVGRRTDFIRDVTDGNDYPITRYNSVGVPSREEIEFGELVYKRNMNDRRMAELKVGYPKRTKPKKKRRRRVVETITRVIHEESEDDGSSVSDRHLQLKGGRYGRGYYDSPDRSYISQKPTHARQSFDRRRSDSSDAEVAARSRDQDNYARQHSSQGNHTQGLASRKRRYPEQAASGASRKTKSRPSSMLEDLD